MKIHKLLTTTLLMLLLIMLTFPTYAADLTQLNQEKAKLMQEIDALKSEEQQLPNMQVGVTILKENQSETSMMQNYILPPANVQLQDDGSYLVHLTIKNPEFWKSFIVNGNDVVMISDNGDTAVVEFSVASLIELATVNIHIVVPTINYDNNYITYIQFNASDAEKLKLSKNSKLDELTAQLASVNQQIEREKTTENKEIVSDSKTEKTSKVTDITSQNKVKKQIPKTTENKLPMPVFIISTLIVIAAVVAWLMRKKRS